MRIGWLCVVGLLAACDARKDAPKPELGAPIHGASDPGPIHFRFAPPDGTEFVQTVFRRTDRHCEALPSSLFESEEKIAVKIRRSGSGYEMKRRFLSLRTWLNGSGYNDHDLARRLGVELTYRIDAEGRLLAVDGMGEIVREFRSTLRGAPIPPSLTIGERDLLAGETYQWSRQIGLLAGSEIAIGGAVETTTSLPLSGGRSVSIPGQIKVARLAYCPTHCVLAWFEARSNDSALAEFLADVVSSDPAPRRQGRKVKPIASGVAIEADLVIDPDTMRVYRDIGKQTTVFQIEEPGYGPAAYRVTQEWRYTIDPPSEGP